jgi:dTDP-4-dehydrorhamnose 3,5-epimerase
MKINETKLAGLFVITNDLMGDSRGSFARFFCDREFFPVIGERRIVQINHSFTRAIGALRGLHFQIPPYSEMKIVRCIKGKVFDVVLDLRKESTTFLQWHSEILSPESNKVIIIPEGFAHGFQVLEENSELLYLHTEHYEKNAEGGIRFDDPAHSIKWPMPLSDISERDKNHAYIDKNWQGLIL